MKPVSAPAQSLLNDSDWQLLEQGVAQLRLGLSPSQVGALFDYAKLIQKWNKSYNLTAIREGREIITHHILDSLAVVAEFRRLLREHPAPRILDVGSGAGLPGLVLSICEPSWQVSTIDTVQKKAAFMLQAAAVLKLANTKVVHGRVEKHHDLPFDLICSRAFASLADFTGWSGHLLAPGGVFGALKGRLEVDQTVPSPWQIQAIIPIEVPFLDESRHLFLIRR